MTGPSANYPRCLAATGVREACAGLVEDLHERWELPSAYLLVDGRLRCQASRGYFQVSDGFTTSTGVIGRVVSSGVGEVLQDVRQESSFVAAVPGLVAEACLPVRVFGQVVGAVNLEARGPLPDEAVADLEQAAAVLGARLEALGGLPAPSLAERGARLAVELAQETGVTRLRRRTVRGARELSSMSTAALAELVDGGWAVTHASGPLAHVLRSWETPVLDVLSRWVQAKTSSYFPPGEAVPPGYEFLAGEVAALSVQPLVVAGQVVGLLLTADQRPAAHDPTRVVAMELLASQAAALLATAHTVAELSRQALRDPLTGLRNRRGLVDQLQAASRRDGQALVLLDLDGFKAVNDRFGHARGDALLCEVADRIRQATRQGDLVFRLGGDEFAVLVRDVPLPEQALELGRRFVAAATVDDGDVDDLRVGASAGVRLLTPDSAGTAVHDADAALYAAKHSGRGTAALWHPLLPRQPLPPAPAGDRRTGTRQVPGAASSRT